MTQFNRLFTMALRGVLFRNQNGHKSIPRTELKVFK